MDREAHALYVPLPCTYTKKLLFELFLCIFSTSRGRRLRMGSQTPLGHDFLRKSRFWEPNKGSKIDKKWRHSWGGPDIFTLLGLTWPFLALLGPTWAPFCTPTTAYLGGFSDDFLWLQPPAPNAGALGLMAGGDARSAFNFVTLLGPGLEHRPKN